MPQERFRETGKDSFFGDLVYDRVVPKTTSSASSTRWWIGVPSPRSWCGTTKGATEYGPPPYEPVLLLKMLLLSYLYDLSERQTEDLVSYHLLAKWFVGLAVDEAAPDHASLTVFKNRLLARRGEQVFTALFQDIIRLAQERGVGFGRIQVVDSVHTVADVNVEQDEGRQHGGQGPRDGDAAWGAKGKKRRRDASGQPQG